MKRIARIFLIALAAVPALGAVHPAAARSDRAAMHISAFVAPVVRWNLQHQDSSVTITDADIARGFVTAPRATVVDVRTNLREGLTLSVRSTAPWLNRLWLVDGDRTIEMAPGEGFARLLCLSGSAGERKEIGYRFFLKDSIEPGTYPWPVTIRPTAF